MVQFSTKRNKRHRFVKLNNIKLIVPAVLMIVSFGIIHLRLRRTNANPPPPPSHPYMTPKKQPVGHNVAVRHNSNYSNETLPDWILEYGQWHAQQLQSLTEENYAQHKFLVLRCLNTDVRCGGLSDRIKPLPLLLLWAYQSQRIFFIHWEKPCALEEFLVPPPLEEDGGDGALLLDWRLLSWMIPRVQQGWLPMPHRLLSAIHSRQTMVCAQIHDQHGGSEQYNALQQPQRDRAFRQDYGPIFRSLFAPTRPLANALAQEQERFQLHGDYAAAHFRAHYGSNLTTSQIRWFTQLVLNCASQLRPGGVPILFASDSKLAMQFAQSYAGTHNNIVTLDRPHEPLHLDRASSTHPEDYFDTFLDLFHFANANCISHGQGGFGRLGVLLSKNTSCLMPFITKGRIVECEWRD